MGLMRLAEAKSEAGGAHRRGMHDMQDGVSRREFLKQSSTAAVAAGLGLSAANPARSQTVSANEKIVLGFIGVAGRGRRVMEAFKQYPDVEIAAICDVYRPHLEQGIELAGGKARGYHDFRVLLAQKDLDAVVITTPPHWHALMFIYACQAGKDVYCEKPMCRYPAEARAMVKAARQNNRVTQIGTQIHAGSNYRRVVEIVRSGVLGKISCVRNILTLNEAPDGIGKEANTSPPEDLDWDMWLGPAPRVPFNWQRFKSGHHRYFADYSGSWLREMGPHIVDLPFWALQLGPPKSAQAIGGKFVTDDISEIPDTMDVLWEFPGLNMTWMNTCANSYNFGYGQAPNRGRRLRIIFQGLNATLVSDYGTHEIISEGKAMEEVELPEPPEEEPTGHQREFLDSIKSRWQPSCNVEYHYPIAIALCLGQIALEKGRKLEWDDDKGRVIHHPQGAAIVKPKYRKPWKLPT